MNGNPFFKYPLRLMNGVAASSVLLPSIIIGLTAVQLAFQPMDGDGDDRMGSLSLVLTLSSFEFLSLLFLSLFRSFAWCFTIISSNVFRGWLWACNDKSQSTHCFHIQTISSYHSYLVLSVQILYVENRSQVWSVIDTGPSPRMLLIHTGNGPLQTLRTNRVTACSQESCRNCKVGFRVLFI